MNKLLKRCLFFFLITVGISVFFVLREINGPRDIERVVFVCLLTLILMELIAVGSYFAEKRADKKFNAEAMNTVNIHNKNINGLNTAGASDYFNKGKSMKSQLYRMSFGFIHIVALFASALLFYCIGIYISEANYVMAVVVALAGLGILAYVIYCVLGINVKRFCNKLEKTYNIRQVEYDYLAGKLYRKGRVAINIGSLFTVVLINGKISILENRNIFFVQHAVIQQKQYLNSIYSGMEIKHCVRIAVRNNGGLTPQYELKPRLSNNLVEIVLDEYRRIGINVI